MKSFNKIMGSLIVFCVIMLPIIVYMDHKENNSPELYKVNFGIIKTAITFSSNGGIFGGELQTRINTDKKSIVILGIPTVAIGDTLWLRYSKSRIFILTELGNRINITNR